MTEPVIVANMIRTPDGTILQSMHVHDFVQYVDKNGKEYMVDGGLIYLRRNVHEDAPYEELSVYAHDDHDLIREHMHWGTYGPKGDQPRKWVRVKDLETDHIEAILENCHLRPEFELIFKRERMRRIIEGISYEYL